jgi:hypothetical protein
MEREVKQFMPAVAMAIAALGLSCLTSGIPAAHAEGKFGAYHPSQGSPETPSTGGGIVTSNGNSWATHACQHAGYLVEEQDNGGGFTNVGDCVSYAAHGGKLFDPTLSLAQINSHGDYSIVGTGFHASSPIRLIRVYHPTGDVFNRVDWATNGAGMFSTNLWACYALNTSVTVEALDASGVHRTATLSVNCP